PVLRRRNEPAALRGPLVDARAEQAGGVRDVALGLEGLLRAGAREVLDPVGAESLVARHGNREVGAAEEARQRLALHVARHHELPGRGALELADAAAEPARADHRRGLALGVDV